MKILVSRKLVKTVLRKPLFIFLEDPSNIGMYTNENRELEKEVDTSCNTKIKRYQSNTIVVLNDTLMGFVVKLLFLYYMLLKNNFSTMI